MPVVKNTFKEQLQKRSLIEIEALLIEQKRKISAEKDLATLHRLTSELSQIQEIRDQKQRESGHMIRKNAKSPDKPELKTFDDYVKSKKK